MNHVLKTLWPHYNQAIGKMVLETVTPQIEDVIKQVTPCIAAFFGTVQCLFGDNAQLCPCMR